MSLTESHRERAAPALAARSQWSLYSRRQRWLFLVVLFLISTSNYFDRHVISVLLEPIKQEFHVSDTLLGLLSGICFALCYTVLGIPAARWADRGNRRSVITLALTVWSVMTLACGLAQSFWQLALARVGVGAGESGAIAPSQSLLIDYFPPGSRATALSVLAAAGTVGSLLAFAVGGYIAALHGWRSAFLCAGAPGLLLALIARMSLAEPRLVLPIASVAVSRESTREALRTLWSKRSFRYALAGSVFTFLMQYGGLVFVPSFLTRVMGASPAEVSVTYGAVVAAASLTGTLGGGLLADKLGRRDVRWFAWLPALACTVTAPIYVLAFASMEIQVFMALTFVGYVLLTGGSPPVFAAVHAVCGASRRAMAIAVLLFAATLFGAGLGPLAAGALSDWLSFSFGTEGLRYSLMAMMSVLPASGVFFYLFGRAMPRDLEP